MKFIELTVGNHQIVHGFDNLNQEIITTVEGIKPQKKLISTDRILSISEKYILTTYLDRLIYWEYEESYHDVKSLLFIE